MNVLQRAYLYGVKEAEAAVGAPPPLQVSSPIPPPGPSKATQTKPLTSKLPLSPTGAAPNLLSAPGTPSPISVPPALPTPAQGVAANLHTAAAGQALGAQPAMKIGSYAGVKLAFQDNPRQRVDTVSPGETSNSQPRGSNTWHTNPHEIAPDNGPRRLGTNFSEPWRQGLNIDQAVHKAFQDLLVPRPADFLNEANQGYIGPPGAGANW